MEEFTRGDFKIRLVGDFDGIDAKVFFGIFGNLTKAMRHINDGLRPGQPARIELKKLEPVSDGIDVLLSADPQVIVAFIEILEIKRHLKGKVPVEVRFSGFQDGH